MLGLVTCGPRKGTEEETDRLPKPKDGEERDGVLLPEHDIAVVTVSLLGLPKWRGKVGRGRLGKRKGVNGSGWEEVEG